MIGSDFQDRTFDEKVEYLREETVKEVKVTIKNPNASVMNAIYSLSGNKLPKKDAINALRYAQGDEEKALEYLLLQQRARKERFG